MPRTNQDQSEFLHLTLPARPASLRSLREHVRRFVTGLPMSPDRQAETVLAVDEAATNAVEHAYEPDRPGEIELTAWTESDAVCIQVSDRGSWQEPAAESRRRNRGFGIPLMHRLVDAVLIQRGPRGTLVLLRRLISDPPPAAPSRGRRHRHARRKPVTGRRFGFA